MDPDTIIIVGAGMAGGRAAIALRSNGFTGRVLLIGQESDPPYERPPLSKGFLRGEQSPDSLAITPKGQTWADIDVELQTGVQVMSVDAGRRTVALGTGEHIGYDRMLLATGSEPRSLDVPGSDLPEVMRLRTREDAERIRALLTSGDPVVVVGGGWIGAEVAACARQLGAPVALCTGRSSLFQRALGAEVAARYADLHRSHGVDLRQAAQVTAIEDRAGQVRGVRLHDGAVIDARGVIVGVGATPRLDLARSAGLVVDDGVRIDARFRTSDPGIWAVGDIAVMRHPVLDRDVRLDHWAAAWFGGTAAARSMLGDETPYGRIPYLYSDQYDLSMEAWGVPQEWDRVVIRHVDDGAFLAFWLADGRVTGTMLGNMPDARKPLEALVRTMARPEPSLLADAAVALDDLTPT